jgi:intein-encoded DNA endonuclease-like protein
MSIKEGLKKHRDYIINSYKSGISTVKLGKEFNCNPASIYLFLKEHHVEIKQRSKNYGEVETRRVEIEKLYKEGLSAYTISKKLGIAKITILRYGKIWNLDFSSKSKLQAPIRMKDQEDLIIELHKKGHSGGEIAKIVGNSRSQITEFLGKEGFILQKNLHETNLDFFKVIDNEIKAYILGFWYADGNVVSDKIRLQITDLDILERIQKEMGYDGELYISPPRKVHYKTQYCLSIARKEMVKDLIKLGCVPNKSLITKFPTNDMVPKELIRHFIRGYNDGDGNIYINKKSHSIKCQLVGTKEFLQGIEDFCRELSIKCYWSQRFPERKANNYNLTISSNSNSLKFFEEIYRESNIHLERKYEIYKSFSV